MTMLRSITTNSRPLGRSDSEEELVLSLPSGHSWRPLTEVVNQDMNQESEFLGGSSTSSAGSDYRLSAPSAEHDSPGSSHEDSNATFAAQDNSVEEDTEGDSEGLDEPEDSLVISLLDEDPDVW